MFLSWFSSRILHMPICICSDYFSYWVRKIDYTEGHVKDCFLFGWLVVHFVLWWRLIFSTMIKWYSLPHHPQRSPKKKIHYLRPPQDPKNMYFNLPEKYSNIPGIFPQKDFRNILLIFFSPFLLINISIFLLLLFY